MNKKEYTNETRIKWCDLGPQESAEAIEQYIASLAIAPCLCPPRDLFPPQF
jgi:hypothetical protein